MFGKHDRIIRHIWKALRPTRYTFGQPRSIKGKVDNRILFSGEMYDPSGLIYLRARYYDPVVGRFLTEDTLFGELDDPLSQNLYLYCANNPVVYVDPTGH
ncbi:MAG: RHS repeat-associated core domain-containing protein, partial [Syntrophomonadaceae bacterium]|nr:RHS repeat-associated core domain-containing protein [Syntrophomonadaceae bacterium]